MAAATASAAFPGWGQLRVGQRRVGAGLVGGTALLFAASAAALSVDGAGGVLRWMVDPELILTLLILDLLVALIRLCSTTFAWLAAGGRFMSVGLLAILTFVAVPHVALGYYGLETRSTLLQVFPADPAPVALAATTTASAVVASTSAPATTPPAPTTRAPLTKGILPVPEVALPSTTTPPSTTTTTLPLGTERLTVLLLGADAGPGRRGVRTDAVIVASVNTMSGDAVLFGLPRNLGGLTFADGSEFPGLPLGMLNEVYQWAWRHPDRFTGQDPGATAVSNVASTLLGIPIDHYVMVDMVGFAEVVDVLGGVTVHVEGEVQAPLYDRSSGTHTMITIPAGDQRLDGDHALAYTRSRTGSNDYSRMARQRCLLTSLAAQAEPLRLFARFTEILATIEARVTTDIPLSKIPSIVNLLTRVDPERVLLVGFDRSYGAGRTEKGLMIPDAERIRAEVQAALSGKVPESSELVAAAGACSA